MMTWLDLSSVNFINFTVERGSCRLWSESIGGVLVVLWWCFGGALVVAAARKAAKPGIWPGVLRVISAVLVLAWLWREGNPADRARERFVARRRAGYVVG